VKNYSRNFLHIQFFISEGKEWAISILGEWELQKPRRAYEKAPSLHSSRIENGVKKV